MRRRLIGLLVVGILVIASAASGHPSSSTVPAISVWQPGGIGPLAAQAVADTADAHRADWALVRSGTIQLLQVSRGEEVIQDARPGYRYPMSAIAIDPEAARGHIGEEAADALAAGTMVFGESSASLRGAMPGDVVRFYGWDSVIYEMTVGAIVADELVGSAEMVFSTVNADEFEFDRLSSVWVWNLSHQDAFLIDLWQALPPGTTRIRSSNDPPDPDSVLSVIRVKQQFGEFSYRPLAGDNIVIDPEWVRNNIQTRTLPLLGTFRCHKDIWPLLEQAMEQIITARADGHLRRSDFRSPGGCYNAREIRGGDKGGSISRHSWGIAIDINPSSNPYGGRITMHPTIVEIFHDLGFAWGGGWTFSDGGHFEWKTDLHQSPSALPGLGR